MRAPTLVLGVLILVALGLGLGLGLGLISRPGVRLLECTSADCRPFTMGYWKTYNNLMSGFVAMPASSAEVAAAFRWAAAHDLSVSIKGCGHGDGNSVQNGSLLIDMTALNDANNGLGPFSFVENVRKSGGEWYADVGPSASDITANLAVVNLVGSTTSDGDLVPRLRVNGGHYSGVCIGGWTLSGGSGPDSRLHGWGVDSVAELTVVLTNATILTVDARNPGAQADLLWALLGGGGSFGCVTRLRVRLVRVDGYVQTVTSLTWKRDSMEHMLQYIQLWQRMLPSRISASNLAVTATTKSVHGDVLLTTKYYSWIGYAADGQSSTYPLDQAGAARAMESENERVAAFEAAHSRSLASENRSSETLTAKEYTLEVYGCGSDPTCASAYAPERDHNATFLLLGTFMNSATFTVRGAAESLQRVGCGTGALPRATLLVPSHALPCSPRPN